MKGMQEMDSHGHLRSECIVFHPPLKDKGEFTKQLVFKLISSSYPGYQVIVQAIISSRGSRQHTFQQPSIVKWPRLTGWALVRLRTENC